MSTGVASVSLTPGGVFRRHPQVLAVRRHREAVGLRTHRQVLHDAAAVGIDEMNEIAGTHVDEPTVFADRYVFRLCAGWHFVDDDIPVHIDDRQRRFFPVGDINSAPPFVDAKGLGGRSGDQPADDLKPADVDDVDGVVAAAGNVELGVIVVEMHVARLSRCLEMFDDFVGLRVDDDDVIVLFGAHENQSGVLGKSTRGCGRKDRDKET